MSKLYKSLLAAVALMFMLAGSVVIDSTPAKAQTIAGVPGNLNAKAGLNKGEVVLNWTAGANTNRYALVYGLSSGNYLFGSLNIDGGTNTTYTVTNLNPGTRYFFQVWAFNTNEGPATPSQEVFLVAP